MHSFGLKTATVAVHLAEEWNSQASSLASKSVGVFWRQTTRDCLRSQTIIILAVYVKFFKTALCITTWTMNLSGMLVLPLWMSTNSPAYSLSFICSTISMSSVMISRKSSLMANSRALVSLLLLVEKWIRCFLSPPQASTILEDMSAVICDLDGLNDTWLLYTDNRRTEIHDALSYLFLHLRMHKRRNGASIKYINKWH